MKSFRVRFSGYADVTASDVWPNGDAPESPTTSDVRAALELEFESDPPENGVTITSVDVTECTDRSIRANTEPPAG